MSLLCYLGTVRYVLVESWKNGVIYGVMYGVMYGVIFSIIDDVNVH